MVQLAARLNDGSQVTIDESAMNAPFETRGVTSSLGVLVLCSMLDRMLYESQKGHQAAATVAPPSKDGLAFTTPAVGMTVRATSSKPGAPEGKPTLAFSKGDELTINEILEEGGKWFATDKIFRTLWFPLSSTDWNGQRQTSNQTSEPNADPKESDASTFKAVRELLEILLDSGLDLNGTTIDSDPAASWKRVPNAAYLFFQANRVDHSLAMKLLDVFADAPDWNSECVVLEAGREEDVMISGLVVLKHALPSNSNSQLQFGMQDSPEDDSQSLAAQASFEVDQIIPDEWQMGYHYQMAEDDTFEMNEICVIERSDGICPLHWPTNCILHAF